ncbi:MAG TPA: biotin/lipoyl-containing protein [Streptosporangiaceae bacterium]|nr:biotin/lipoyl-containing protein [Streptosporangiaceae bacterium]
MDLTSEDVRDILQLLDGLPYREMTLETASFRLSLRRSADGGWTQATEVLAEPAGPAVLAEPAGPAVLAEPAATTTAPSEPAPDAAAEGLVDVRAPLLGTFYRAPRPGAPPFVTVGSEVEPDTVVCIIETMKLMNSVTAGVTGAVAEILAENAQFAGQGTVLMRVRPTGEQQ